MRIISKKAFNRLNYPDEVSREMIGNYFALISFDKGAVRIPLMTIVTYVFHIYKRLKII